MKSSHAALFALVAATFAFPALLRANPGDAVAERGFLETPISVPTNVLQTVGALLPERVTINPNLISATFDPNLQFTAPANVWVTFLAEGAGYLNSVGYFTYRVDSGAVQIVDRQLIFPNASGAGSGGTLNAGDKVTLRDAQGNVRVFQPGERVGFFLISNGWNGHGVTGWDPSNPQLPSASAAQNGSGGNIYTTIPGLNPEMANGHPELATHFATIAMAGIPGFLGGSSWVLIGAEDLRRDGGSDNDFNDVVFMAQGNPIDAVAPGSAASYDPLNPDPDGDGVSGVADAYPHDPTRATIVRTPAAGLDSVVFEDNYPAFGDGDYNDAVVQYAWERVLDAQGNVRDLQGTFYLVARGANYDHTFGVAVRGLPSNLTGTYEIERFTSDGTESLQAAAPLTSIADANGSAYALRFGDVFPSTKAALPQSWDSTTNTASVTPTTPPAAVRVVVHLDQRIPATQFGTPPFDPFLTVHPANETIHLAGTAIFDDDAVTTVGTATPFVSSNGQPWAMVVPSSFRYPLEKISIQKAYPSFQTWSITHGASAPTWYRSPSAGKVINGLVDSALAQPWSISI